MVATAVLIVRGRLSLRAGLAALAFIVVAWLGLLISLSQSSFAALFVAVLALAVKTGHAQCPHRHPATPLGPPGAGIVGGVARAGDLYLE